MPLSVDGHRSFGFVHSLGRTVTDLPAVTIFVQFSFGRSMEHAVLDIDMPSGGLRLSISCEGRDEP